MSRLILLYRSIVGKKAIVAATGALMLAFLVFHASGNLKVFLPEASPGVPDIDAYAHFLRTVGDPLLPHGLGLWMFRVILGAALILHVVCVVQLALYNRRARPVHYERVDYDKANASGRWMLYTGALLLLFLVIHVLHFTTGDLDPQRFVEGAAYANLHHAFQRGVYVAFYWSAMLVLALHLYHGTWSLFQSLGLDNPDRNRGLRRMALVLAVLLPLVFAAVPGAFVSGRMEAPPTPGDALAGGGDR